MVDSGSEVIKSKNITDFYKIEADLGQYIFFLTLLSLFRGSFAVVKLAYNKKTG